MKIATIIIFFLLPYAVIAQDDNVKILKSPNNKGDSIISYEILSIDTINLTTVIKNTKYSCDKYVRQAEKSKAIVLKTIKTTNYSNDSFGGKQIRIDYMTSDFPSVNSYIILEKEHCTKIQSFINQIGKSKFSEIHCMVLKDFSVGIYNRNGENIYYLLMGGVEYSLINEELFKKELSKFTSLSSDKV